jgi:hypothetical protein
MVLGIVSITVGPTPVLVDPNPCKDEYVVEPRPDAEDVTKVLASVGVPSVGVA